MRRLDLGYACVAGGIYGSREIGCGLGINGSKGDDSGVRVTVNFGVILELRVCVLMQIYGILRILLILVFREGFFIILFNQFNVCSICTFSRNSPHNFKTDPNFIIIILLKNSKLTSNSVDFNYIYYY